MSIIQISITPSIVLSTIVNTITATFTPTPSIIQTQVPGYLQDTNVIDTFIGEVIFIIVVAITTTIIICRNRNHQNELKVLKQDFENQRIINNVHALQEQSG